MSWTCDKHEWDEGSENWKKYMAKKYVPFAHSGKNGREFICPICVDELRAENEALVRVRAAAQEIIDWQDTGPRQQPISVLAKELAPRIDKLRAALLQEKEIGK